MMAPALVPVLLLILGALVAFLGGPKLRRASLAAVPMALAALVAAHAVGGSGWWVADRLGLVLGVTALVIGLCACRFTLVQFDRERRGGPILAASYLVVASVLAMDLAATSGAIAVAWIATSASTLLLLRAGSAGWGTAVVRRAAVTFALVDGALLVGLLASGALRGHALATTVGTHGPALHGLAAVLLLAGVAAAAVGRAGMALNGSWVEATIATPTSVSALLHAGVVNAGALLLLRLAPLAGPARWFQLGLALACGVVLIVLAPRIDSRVDLKGQLAASTISQMAFMLLAIALGWPLLALTHLIGHGLYKAGRFMGSGGAIASRARLRRRAPAGRSLDGPVRLLGAATIVTVAAIAGIAQGGDVLAAMAVMGPAAAWVWWVRTREPIRRPVPAVGWLVLGLALYGAVVRGAEVLLGGAIAPEVLRAPWWTLGACVAIVTASAALRRDRPPVVAPVLALASSAARRDEEVAA